VGSGDIRFPVRFGVSLHLVRPLLGLPLCIDRLFHVRAPICFTSSSTSNGSPFFTMPAHNFFIGNVAAT